MNRFFCAAATAALMLAAGPAAAQQGYTPPPGYVLVPAPSPAAQATTPAPSAGRDFALNAQAGLLFPGTISVEGTEVDTKSGVVLRAGADFFLIPKLSLGVFVLNARTSAKDADVDVSMVGLGGAIVGHFGSPDRAHLRTGLEISYQLDTIDTPGAKDAKGLGVAGFLEGVIPASPEVNLLARLGFITQPTGGNSDVDVSWGPIFYVSVGAEFSR